MIRAVTAADAKQIAEIYNHYVLNTTVTFEETPVKPDDMAGRIENVRAEYPWLVYETGGFIAGYAYATSWKTRSAYRHTVESTVYLGADSIGQGIGSLLYAELLNNLRAQNIHAVIAGVALPNEASIRLHEKFGFTDVAQFREVGLKFGNWIDVGYWELILD